MVLEALQSVPALWHKLPQMQLLNSFQNMCRGSQVYIEMSHLAAMVFAKNDKRGGYTGYFKQIPRSVPCNSIKFLKANMLGGFFSRVHCHIQKDGPYGLTTLVSYTKDAVDTQIPYLHYCSKPVNDLPKPTGWSPTPMSDDQLLDINIKEVGSKLILQAADPKLEFKATKRNPRWAELVDHIEAEGISSVKELQ